MKKKLVKKKSEIFSVMCYHYIIMLLISASAGSYQEVYFFLYVEDPMGHGEKSRRYMCTCREDIDIRHAQVAVNLGIGRG